MGSVGGGERGEERVGGPRLELTSQVGAENPGANLGHPAEAVLIDELEN